MVFLVDHWGWQWLCVNSEAGPQVAGRKFLVEWKGIGEVPGRYLTCQMVRTMIELAGPELPAQDNRSRRMIEKGVAWESLAKDLIWRRGGIVSTSCNRSQVCS